MVFGAKINENYESAANIGIKSHFRMYICVTNHIFGHGCAVHGSWF